MKDDVLEEIIHENSLPREERGSQNKKELENKEFPLICEKTRVGGERVMKLLELPSR